MHDVPVPPIVWATEIIAFCAVGVLLVAVLLGATLYRKLSSGIRFFWYYLLMVLIIELVAKFYAYVLVVTNVYLLHVYTLLEFVLLMLFFRETLRLPRAWRRVIIWVICVISAVQIVYSTSILFWHSEMLLQEHFQFYSKIITNFFILFFSVLFFIRFISGGIQKDGKFLFWIYAGLLTYFSGSFVIFMALNQLVRTPVTEGILPWLINATLTLLFYVIIIIAFLIQRQTWKRLQPG